VTPSRRVRRVELIALERLVLVPVRMWYVMQINTTQVIRPHDFIAELDAPFNARVAPKPLL